MNQFYDEYNRFMAAAKKFPRWSNIKRRPINSTGGKLLKSIIEEIAKVEDAVIEYKKDFFIVNYVGREDEIIDYLYTAQIGNLEDISKNLHIEYPEKITDVTEDAETFYKNKTYAYYKNGYIVSRAISDTIRYNYKGFVYTIPSKKTAIWNIIDEFAWWSGIERLKNETNKELMIRTFAQLRNRADSSEQGIKNAIKNVLSNYGQISDDDIKIEQPNQENMSEMLQGKTLYEIIAQFNRDIARTKKWDLDYWDNEFRSLGYIPHVWDAPVKQYKDGTGYNDSLKIRSLKELDTGSSTNVQINGWKMDVEKVDEYFKKNQISKNISLQMTKYGDEVNSIPVSYKVNASTLTKIEEPYNIFIEAYSISNSNKEYYIDDLFLDKENIDVIDGDSLESDKTYTIKFTPEDDPLSVMEIQECTLSDGDGVKKNILVQKGKFGYDERGLFKNKSVIFHAENVSKFNSSDGIVDNEYGGMRLAENRTEGSLECSLGKAAEHGAVPVTIKVECESYDASDYPNIAKMENVTYSNGKYISGDSEVEPSTLIFTLPKSKDISFDIRKHGTYLGSAYATIETYINNEYVKDFSYDHALVTEFNYSISLSKLSDVKIIIKRDTRIPFELDNLKIMRFEMAAFVNGNEIKLDEKGSALIPQGENTDFRIEFQNYGKHTPVIECVHIGGLMYALTSTYKFTFDTKKIKNPKLNIDTNCKVEIIDNATNKPLRYETHLTYVNNTKKIQGIYLDLSRFKEILFSSKPIRHSSVNQAYIELVPGESLKSISIAGKSEMLMSKKSFSEALKLEEKDVLYANKEIKGFIKKNGNRENFVELKEEDCSYKEADFYRITGLDKPKLKACFIGNRLNDVQSFNDEYFGQFETLYLFSEEYNQYINYNFQNIIKPVSEGFCIIKSFSPAIPANEKVLYIIQDVISDKGYKLNINFASGRKWSTDINETITINADIDILEDQIIKRTETVLNNVFILANTIPLKEYYIINNQIYNLAEYTITPPEDMKIEYSKKKLSTPEYIIVEDDGFNKLTYTNISDIKVFINKVEISPADYRILNEEGIICWNNDSYVGQFAEITYNYLQPREIRFKNIKDIYEIAGYSYETLKKIETENPYIVENLTKGSKIKIDYSYFGKEKPDKITLDFSNKCYSGIIVDDTIKIERIAAENNLLIHNGYYYIDGKEYWYFANKYEEDRESFDGIKHHNVDKLGKELYLNKEAINFLENSKMICNHMNTHCMVDYTYPDVVPSISSLEHIGACDSCAHWLTYKMTASLRNDNGNDSIEFVSQSDSGHAILDITEAIKTKKMLSLMISGKLRAFIGEDTMINGSFLKQELFIKEKAIMTRKNDKLYYSCKDLVPDEHRYYLIVKGSGILNEILVTNAENIDDINNDHESAFQRFGFDFKEELEDIDEIPLDFSRIGLNFDKAEISRDGVLQVSTNIHWGLTPIKIRLDNVEKNGFTYSNGILTANIEGAYARVSMLSAPPKNAKKYYIKINNYPHDELKNFQINIYKKEYSNYRKLASFPNTNIAVISTENIKSGLRFEILAEEGKVINDITILAEYVERKDGYNLGTYKIFEEGECSTKIYTIPGIKKCFLKNVVASGDTKGVSYYVRGLRVDETDNEWTRWYSLESGHVFEDYEYFQFKVKINNNKSKIKIKRFILGVKNDV